MPELTKKPPIDSECFISAAPQQPAGFLHIEVSSPSTSEDWEEVTLIGPADKFKQLMRVAKLLEFEDANESTSAEDLMPDFTPAKFLQLYHDREELTKGELADKVGTTKNHLSQMENGDAEITQEMAEKLGRALNCDAKRFRLH